MSPGQFSTESLQKIKFSETEEYNCVRIKSKNVTVISSIGDHVTGSSKVKMNNIVNYSWEEKYYTGQLLAIHRDGNYIAYCIKGAKSDWFIRVLNRESSKRALIKSVKGMVEDLAFAFIPNQVILASIDQVGNVHIHNIHENTVDIICSLILRIKGHALDSEDPKRIIWCPYLPNQSAKSSPDTCADGLLLAVTRGTKMQIWHVNTVDSNSPSTSYSGSCSPGFFSTNAHSNTIVDAAFSPDGSVIATASHDGKCKFFQVYMHGETRCLHEWEPHGGEPVTLLFFLDNYKFFDQDTQFWKYAVTGTKDNCELKLWCCDKWECIQTIRFTSKNSQTFPAKKLKAAIDLTAGYILLSDMYYRLLYVVELDKTNQSHPYVKTISEFKLPYPILSFGIVDAGPKNFKPSTPFNLKDLCNGDEEVDCQVTVMVKMYIVQPKSLQECHIVFQPSKSNTIFPIQLSSLVHESLENQNSMTDISSDLNNLDSSKSNTTPQPPPKMNILTPDGFHSPTNKDFNTLDNENTPLPDSSDSYTNSATASVSNSDNLAVGDDFVTDRSSPSRQVQEIHSFPCCFVSSSSPQSAQQRVSEFPSESPNKLCVPEVTSSNLSEIENSINSLKGDVATLTEKLQNHAKEIQLLREVLQPSYINHANLISRVISDGVCKCIIDEDQLLAHLVKEVRANILTSVLPQVIAEIKENIKQVISNTLIELKEIIRTELLQGLTIINQKLKDNINKILKSKSMKELLTSILTDAATASLEKMYRETFFKTLLPTFEKACTCMFNQFTGTLSQGLKEYVQEADLYCIKSKERSDMELLTVQSATKDLTATAEQFTTTADIEIDRFSDIVQELQNTILTVNLNNGLMGADIVKLAITDPYLFESELSKMIFQENFDAAFQQALNASNLNMVMYVCEKVPPYKVFTEDGCILQQHVLLSLIQQLSSDINQRSDLKLKYIEKAVVSLDVDNLNTRKHMPSVLRGLHKQLNFFLTANPDTKLAKNIKRLQMAAHVILTP